MSDLVSLNSRDRYPLLAHVLETLVSVRLPLLVLFAALVIDAAILPSVSWITKKGIEAVQMPDATIASVFLSVGYLYLIIRTAAYLCKIFEKIAGKLVEARVIISLQRRYVDRRDKAGADELSHVFYGTQVAANGLEVVYLDSFRVVAQTASVFLWQISIAPEWIPVMLGAVAPMLLVAILFGPYIQRVSGQILASQRAIATSASVGSEQALHQSQERVFLQILRYELLRWGSEGAVLASMWSVLLLVFGLPFLFGVDLTPGHGDIAAMGAFLVQVQLLAKPISSISRIYTKWRASVPALLESYRLQDR